MTAHYALALYLRVSALKATFGNYQATFQATFIFGKGGLDIHHG